MRKGFEGLFGLARDRLQFGAFKWTRFLSSNAQRNRLKLLFWDGSGLWVCAESLENGRVWWPPAASGDTKVVLSPQELAMLLGGIDLTGSKRHSFLSPRLQSEALKQDTNGVSTHVGHKLPLHRLVRAQADGPARLISWWASADHGDDPPLLKAMPEVQWHSVAAFQSGLAPGRPHNLKSCQCLFRVVGNWLGNPWRGEPPISDNAA